MPRRNINLTDELDRFVATKVTRGRYEKASEVVRAGLRVCQLVSDHTERIRTGWRQFAITRIARV